MYKIFLQEGKKEDAIQKVKEMFSSPEDSEMIDKIFDATSSLGTKFIPFVENETKRYLINQNTDINDFITLLVNRIRSFIKYITHGRSNQVVFEQSRMGGGKVVR